MTVPDPNRVGGLAWTQRTSGRLTPRERHRLLGAVARTQIIYLGGRLKLLTGRVPPPDALAVEALSPPDSRLAREAERVCAEQPLSTAAHAHRTWKFARALSVLDRARLDVELLYVGALLHDTGLINPVPGEDFTLRSAQHAACCLEAGGRSDGRVELEDALTAHATPGITVDCDGALAAYIQAGAMVDLTGQRSWDLPRHVLDQAASDHPRHAFKTDIVELIRTEAKAVPGGRFSLIHRCGFGIAVRLAPFRD